MSTNGPVVKRTGDSYIRTMVTFIAYVDGKEIMRSDKKWLHPLLDLGESLDWEPPSGRLTTYDRVVGRAGALLATHIGVAEITTDLLSELAADVLAHHGVIVKAARRIPAIDCTTERLLANESDPAAALALIRGRVKAASAKSAK